MDPTSLLNAPTSRKRPIKRHRESLTCTECRARKLKCDRNLPCGACSKRNDSESCAYINSREKNDFDHRDRPSRGNARLQHLETLVHKFIQEKDSAQLPGSGPLPQDELKATESNGYTNDIYIGSTHYSAILEDVEELNHILRADADADAESHFPNSSLEVDESTILFGGTQCLPLSTVLSRYLPSKPQVDRCLAAYFRSEAIAAPFIHIHQFNRQYQEFWTSQHTTSALWISILFSICHMSGNLGRGRQLETSEGPDFSIAAAYCLALGQYHRPQRFAVESLILYIQCKLTANLDPFRDIGILLGTAVQVAYNLGYHRDPSHFKSLTAFDGEMRRRTWSVCIQLDLLISFQLGLPNNVKSGTWDARPPMNLLDSDFDEHLVVLPAERPTTEATRIMFYIAKQKLMTTFDKILRHALSADSSGGELDLIALDAELRKSYDSIPEALHHRSVSRSIADPVYVLVTRRCLELMYQKCLCVLHRKHITTGRVASIAVCNDAASMIVNAFLDMYPEFKPGGQFFADRWLLSSITWNDFLLGVMVLCLILCQHRKHSISGFEPESYQALLTLLRLTREVCFDKANESLGARRIIKLLDCVLSKENPASNNQMKIGNTNDELSSGDGMLGLHSEGQISFGSDSNEFDVVEWAFLENSLGQSF